LVFFLMAIRRCTFSFGGQHLLHPGFGEVQVLFASLPPLLLAGVEEHHIRARDEHVEDPMLTDLQFPKLALDDPELDRCSFQPMEFDVPERCVERGCFVVIERLQILLDGSVAAVGLIKQNFHVTPLS
jgi:hypothetical protein